MARFGFLRAAVLRAPDAEWFPFNWVTLTNVKGDDRPSEQAPPALLLFGEDDEAYVIPRELAGLAREGVEFEAGGNFVYSSDPRFAAAAGTELSLPLFDRRVVPDEESEVVRAHRLRLGRLVRSRSAAAPDG